jgi:DnaJ-class molecular chaperone
MTKEHSKTADPAVGSTRLVRRCPTCKAKGRWFSRGTFPPESGTWVHCSKCNGSGKVTPNDRGQR